MADDERLREALFELQVLRDREAAALNETRVLLNCLEDYTSADTPAQALQSVFRSLKTMLNADLSCILEVFSSGELTVVASDHSEKIGGVIAPPMDLSARSRNVVDLAMAGDWGGTLDLAPYTSLLSCPHVSGTETYVLLALRKTRSGFSKEDLNLGSRLVGLAVQAVLAKDIEAENTLLAATIQGSSSGFAIADATQPDCPLIYVNRAFEEISGYRADEVLGSNCRFVSAEDPNSPERTRLRATVKARTGGYFLLKNRRKNGELFWNELTLFPVKNKAGETLHLVATQNDATERVEASLERDQTRQRMEQALTASDDAYLVLDADRVVSFANEATKATFYAPGPDWAQGSAFQDNWNAFVASASELGGRVTSLLRDADLDRLAGLPHGQEVNLPNGRNVLLRATRIDDGGMVLSATDVTSIRSAQLLLTQRLAAIEAAQDGIAIADADGRILYINTAASTLLGFDASENALGRTWFSQYDGDEKRTLSRAFDVVLTRTESGKTRTHEIRSSPIESGGAVLNFRDVTERLATEAREVELKSGLIRLQRQGAIAQLTAGIAHDFNNLLSAINGTATLIGMDKDLPPRVLPHVERIGTAGVQAARLVNRLLDIGSSSDADATFELADATRDLPSLVEPSLPKDVTLKISAPKTGVLLRGDPGAFSQVMVNLVLNGGDAIAAASGEVSVTFTDEIVHAARDVASGSLQAETEYVRVDVQDNGQGISTDIQGAVFEPYFTTKGRTGTGLGLAIVAMQLQSIGGAVDLVSVEGEGTTVSVYWPVGTTNNTKTTIAKTGNADLSAMTIIIADDDENVASVLAGYLEEMGAEVSVCVDPVDAAEAIEDSPDAWSALITDYDMPTLNGGALVERVRKSTETLPIFVVTALARRLSDPRINDKTVSETFAKPVDFDRLGNALATVNSLKKEL